MTDQVPAIIPPGALASRWTSYPLASGILAGFRPAGIGIMSHPTCRQHRTVASPVQDAARRHKAPVPLRGILDRACARCSFLMQVGTEGMSAPVEQKELA